MEILIYNPNSFGGNYEYALCLLKAYNEQRGVSCKIVLPKICRLAEGNMEGILLSDTHSFQNRILKKLYFIYRSLLNPLIFFFLVKKLKNVDCIIFNDFDQLTAPVWAPLFRFLLPKVKKVVILHDPDRDDYLPNKRLSGFSMQSVMSCMDIALYHEILPEKTYYSEKKLIYKKVPHGLYQLAPKENHKLNKEIDFFKKDKKVLSIIGNIRDEKNYELIISALSDLPEVCLLIAGKVASSSVDLAGYQRLAENSGVTDRVFWLTHYLNESEMQTIIRKRSLSLWAWRWRS